MGQTMLAKRPQVSDTDVLDHATREFGNGDNPGIWRDEGIPGQGSSTTDRR